MAPNPTPTPTPRQIWLKGQEKCHHIQLFIRYFMKTPLDQACAGHSKGSKRRTQAQAPQSSQAKEGMELAPRER